MSQGLEASVRAGPRTGAGEALVCPVGGCPGKVLERPGSAAE